ncbi:4-vinyl reductase [Prosthecomicrobium sp. N25]|uniref:4-vinyl reductase n=1 Tax=Prosthecomicrobium sp. N25 TaxID=3129254 RepID=UPI0030780C7F
MTDAPTSFKDRLRLDEAEGAWWDQGRRYMLIRPDALMGLFLNLPAERRAEAFEALARSITRQGADSARAYRAMGGAGPGLLDIVAATAPQLGWGRWTFSLEPDLLRLTVSNSPFAAGYGASDAPVCHPIRGMMTAVGEMVLDRPVTVVETACAAMGAPDCRFEARPAGGPGAD